MAPARRTRRARLKRDEVTTVPPSPPQTHSPNDPPPARAQAEEIQSTEGFTVQINKESQVARVNQVEELEDKRGVDLFENMGSESSNDHSMSAVTSGTQLETDALDSDLAIEALPALHRKSQEIFQFLLASPPADLLKKIRQPGSQAGKRLDIATRDFSITKELFATSTEFIKVSVSNRLLQTDFFAPLICKANYAALALGLVRTNELSNEAVQYLMHLEMHFPGAFFCTPGGWSEDVQAQVNKLLMDIRTQMFIAAAHHRQASAFDDILRQIFLEPAPDPNSGEDDELHEAWAMGCKPRGWNMFTKAEKARCKARLSTIRSTYIVIDSGVEMEEQLGTDFLVEMWPWGKFVGDMMTFIKQRTLAIDRESGLSEMLSIAEKARERGLRNQEDDDKSGEDEHHTAPNEIDRDASDWLVNQGPTIVPAVEQNRPVSRRKPTTRSSRDRLSSARQLRFLKQQKALLEKQPLEKPRIATTRAAMKALKSLVGAVGSITTSAPVAPAPTASPPPAPAPTASLAPASLAPASPSPAPASLAPALQSPPPPSPPLALPSPPALVQSPPPPPPALTSPPAPPPASLPSPPAQVPKSSPPSPARASPLPARSAGPTTAPPPKRRTRASTNGPVPIQEDNVTSVGADDPIVIPTSTSEKVELFKQLVSRRNNKKRKSASSPKRSILDRQPDAQKIHFHDEEELFETQPHNEPLSTAVETRTRKRRRNDEEEDEEDPYRPVSKTESPKRTKRSKVAPPEREEVSAAPQTVNSPQQVSRVRRSFPAEFSQPETSPPPQHSRQGSPEPARSALVPVPSTQVSRGRIRTRGVKGQAPDSMDEASNLENYGALRKQIRQIANKTRMMNVQKPVQRRRAWTKNEELILIEMVGLYGCQWALIEQVSGLQRGQIQLKDKARNLKFQFLKSRTLLPKGFRNVTMSQRLADDLKKMGIDPEKARSADDIDDEQSDPSTIEEDEFEPIREGVEH